MLDIFVVFSQISTEATLIVTLQAFWSTRSGRHTMKILEDVTSSSLSPERNFLSLRRPRASQCTCLRHAEIIQLIKWHHAVPLKISSLQASLHFQKVSAATIYQKRLFPPLVLLVSNIWAMRVKLSWSVNYEVYVTWYGSDFQRNCWNSNFIRP